MDIFDKYNTRTGYIINSYRVRPDGSWEPLGIDDYSDTVEGDIVDVIKRGEVKKVDTRDRCKKCKSVSRVDIDDIKKEVDLICDNEKCEDKGKKNLYKKW